MIGFKTLFWVVAVAMIVSAPLLATIKTGSGSVTDTIANVETGGLVWRTTEVYLTNDHDAVYCVPPAIMPTGESATASISQAFKTADKTQRFPVTVTYDRYLGYLPWECSANQPYSIAGKITGIKVHEA